MRDLFGKPWDDVEVEDVEAFLAEAGDEGLLWEAKGTEQPHPGSVRKAVSGFANASGGYYIVGAERVDGAGWTLPGIEFKSDEPGTWLSSVITDGMKPVPRFGDPKVFDRPDGKKAVVVRVEPVDVPPCITTDGAVYQRVSGQTKAVTDPAVLANLTRAGQAARNQAEMNAVRAAGRILNEHGFLGEHEVLHSIALCPISGPADLSVQLFTESNVKALLDLVTLRFQPDRRVRYGVGAAVEQDCLRAWANAEEFGQGWTVVMYWTGAVAAVYGTRSAELSTSQLGAGIDSAWLNLAKAVRLIGGEGATHVAVAFDKRHKANTDGQTFPSEVARRWTSDVEPTDYDIGRVIREVERGFGQFSLEA